MSTIKIHDKTFRISYTEKEILEHVKAVADRLNKDMAGKKPLFLAVLNGSFIFAADLLRMIDIPCEISFVKLASYQGTMSTGPDRTYDSDSRRHCRVWPYNETHARIARHT